LSTLNYCRFDPDAEQEQADNPDDEQITDETAAQGSQQSQQSLTTPKALIAANLKSAFSQSKPFSFSFLGGAKEEKVEEERREEEDSKQSALFR
jgi:hypothetical protein